MPRARPSPEPHPTAPLPDMRHAARHGFHREMGFSIDFERSGRGTCTVTGTVEPRHLNLNSVVHGGVYATILDTAMGGAVLSVLAEGETAATTSLYVEFLRAAREGDLLTARGEVLRRGRHLAFAEGNLFGADGRRLSQARGTWYIWSPEAPRGAPTHSIARRRDASHPVASRKVK